MTTRCTADGCDKDAKVKGMCQKHYIRQWRLKRVPSPVRPEDRLEAIKARMRAAAPSPWALVVGNGYSSNEVVTVYNTRHKDSIVRITAPCRVDYSQWTARNTANAEFIAHSREDLAWCVAEIERLQKALSPRP